MLLLVLAVAAAGPVCEPSPDADLYQCGAVRVARCDGPLMCFALAKALDAEAGAVDGEGDWTRLTPAVDEFAGSRIGAHRGRNGLLYELPPIPTEHLVMRWHLVCFGKRAQRAACERALLDVEARWGVDPSTARRRQRERERASAKREAPKPCTTERSGPLRRRICPGFEYQIITHADALAAMSSAGSRAKDAGHGLPGSAPANCSTPGAEFRCTVFFDKARARVIGVSAATPPRSYDCAWKRGPGARALDGLRCREVKVVVDVDALTPTTVPDARVIE